MGSHPTLDDQELAAEALELDPEDWQHRHAVAHLATEHPQVRAWPDDNPDLAHHLDHRDWTYDHHHPSHERAAEEAFDRLNPTFGVPADRSDRVGRQAVRDREAALPWWCGWLCMTAARTTPTRTSGSPARTTA